MEYVFLALAFVPIYRLIKGKTLWDRVVGFSSMSTKMAIFLAFLGFGEHDYLLYVAMVMFLFSLGSVVLLSHFLEE